LEDAQVGFTRDAAMVRRVLAQLQRQLVPPAYRQWHTLGAFRLRLQQAGHILGSAYVEIDAPTPTGTRRVVFSGDLGAPSTPLLPAPRRPARPLCW